MEKRSYDRKRGKFQIDPVHEAIDIFSQPITRDVWKDKYSYYDEEHPFDSMRRVVKGVYALDTKAHAEDALEAMQKALWVPGGRIHAGAGTDKVVTLLNCYVCRTIPDDMKGIGDSLSDAMLTQQQGGGIGMDFSTLRPSGAFLSRTRAVASGPLPFMSMWDSMCSTIMSAGNRRGAMMAVMRDDHPDLPKFITAKHEKGKLTNFNISVLISDAFMDAVMQDEMWDLGFSVPRADGKHVAVVDRDDGKWYIYSQWRARELWDLITRSTYEYSEPGVIFIDRINDQNNLNYCETIAATNPCGEQPLPPNGACNLGAVNLARMVKQPFGLDSEFDFTLLKKVVKVGVRFLDNVIDVTHYPLEAQKMEEVTKRRIGLGITGLANCLAMLRLTYGSEGAIAMTNKIMQTIAYTAYETSAELAVERGPFPLYDGTKWGVDNPVVKALPKKTRDQIASTGIRNGVLLTIAPTGTTSLYMGNISSGLEPVFLFETKRKVRQADNSFKTYTTYDYGMAVFRESGASLPSELPPYLVDHTKLSVQDHVRMQAVCQRWIDASVSKTINIPKSYSYEDFKLVYLDAYNSDCKGCTTYRESDVRGSILSSTTTEAKKKEEARIVKAVRPEELKGTTYKVKWPNEQDAAYYITINELEGKPFEMFIYSTSTKYTEWTTALSLMISAMMRMGHDVNFIPDELKKVISYTDTAWIDGKLYGSLVAMIGDILRKHLNPSVELVSDSQTGLPPAQEKPHTTYMTCPSCGQPALTVQEGCKKCGNCTYSSCG
jgi:ribonucleoside-diphosphate reductase alpha chain